MKILELIHEDKDTGTIVISREAVAGEDKAKPEGNGQHPASTGIGQTTDASPGAGAIWIRPRVIFDPFRGITTAVVRRFGNWGEFTEAIQDIAREAAARQDRAIVRVEKANPSTGQMHELLARLPDNSDVVVLIDRQYD